MRFLLVSGELDNGLGASSVPFWLSIDGERGGFLVSPEAIWSGSEMVRSYSGAARARLDAERHLRVLAGAGRASRARS